MTLKKPNMEEKSLEHEKRLLKKIAMLEEVLAHFRENQNAIDSPLPAREALLDEVEKTAHLGSWFMNLETNEVKWSRELFHILGYDPDKDTATAENYFKRLHPDDLKVALGEMDSLAKTGIMTASDYRMIRTDGSIREILGNGTVITNDEGKIIRVVGTVLDVTDSRKADRDRQELEKQLRQAQKMEVVGRVAGGIAHDFNNLLTIIIGNADLLMTESKDEKIKQIREAADVGAALTRQLLSFSRQSIVKYSPVNLNKAVESMVQILGRLLGENIHIQLNLSPEPLIVMADLGQLEQIVLNLAVNSRDAMLASGELIFTTRKIDSEDQNNWVELLVQDTGSGMDSEIQAQAFEPFFTTKELGKGTGLGLSTVRDIVNQAQGKIALTSVKDSGTSISIQFPEHAGIPAEPISAASKNPSQKKSAKGNSILIVEDNEELRELIRSFLMLDGYKVSALSRPSEAEARFAKEFTDVELLITDMVMPGKNGLDLSKSLLAQKPTLKSLFISGYSPDSPRLIGKNFLQKPFSRQELLNLVSQILEAN